MKEFLNYCSACGGNWGAMLLTGIKRVFPEEYNDVCKQYDSIPCTGGGIHKFAFLCEWLDKHGVKSETDSVKE
jgi:hypothetical protein